jgi:hypothetical protein
MRGTGHSGGAYARVSDVVTDSLRARRFFVTVQLSNLEQRVEKKRRNRMKRRKNIQSQAARHFTSKPRHVMPLFNTPHAPEPLPSLLKASSNIYTF